MTKEYRTIPASEKLAALTPERRARVEQRAAELIAQYTALSDLRKGRRITQAELARRLKGKQTYISRFEKRTDVKVSSLSEYVKGLGGTLDLIVTFPEEQSAYALAGFGGAAPLKPKRTTARKRKK